jgi:hypothetical protein
MFAHINRPLTNLISHIKIYKSTTTDIFFNLATEEYLFEKGKIIMMIYL